MNLNEAYTALTGKVHQINFDSIEISHDDESIILLLTHEDGCIEIKLPYTTEIFDIATDPEDDAQYHHQVDKITSADGIDLFKLGCSKNFEALILEEINKINFKLLTKR